MGITTSSSKKAAGAAPSGRWAPIPDRFSTMAEVQDALRANGLESSNLIVGIDFTKVRKFHYIYL
jgi:E3 ubiquitin-protein ligase RGLG